MLFQNTILTSSLVLALTFGSQQAKASRSVVLPESAAKQMTELCSRPGAPKFDATWAPTEADIKIMESRLSHVSRLSSKSGIIGEQIEHPEKYYRQYVGIVVKDRRLIYINAFCDEQPPSDWAKRVIDVCDGGCSWGVAYDVATGKFSDLEMNGIA